MTAASLRSPIKPEYAPPCSSLIVCSYVLDKKNIKLFGTISWINTDIIIEIAAIIAIISNAFIIRKYIFSSNGLDNIRQQLR